MKRHPFVFTLCSFCACLVYGCNSEQPLSGDAVSPEQSKRLTLVYLLDSLQIRPIVVSDADKAYVKEYKQVYDEFSINFNFPGLSDGSWMLIGRAYGKPRYVVQVKNGKKHGYEIMVDEKSGYVRAITSYYEGKKSGQSTSYSMNGFKDGLFFYSNDKIIDTAYLLYPSGAIQKKRIYQNEKLVRIIDYDRNGQLISDNLQFRDSNITYNYASGKLATKIKHDYSKPGRIIVVHFDSNQAVFEIDTNRIN